MLLPVNGDILKKIATGVGLTCLMFVATVSIPLIGFISAVLIPLPVSYYRYIMGRFAGVLILCISCAFMAVVADGFSFDLSLFASLLIMGYVLGGMLEGGERVEKTVLYPCLSVIGSGIVLAISYTAFNLTELTNLINLYVQKNLELTIELYRQMSMPEETLQKLSNSLETIQYVLVRIIPGIVVMSGLFVSWINMLMTISLARLKGVKIPENESLTQWKSPEVLVWAVIAAGGMMLFPVRFIKIIGLNIVLALVMVYFIQGVSIVSFYFEKRKVPRVLRGILYGLIGVQQLFSLLVVGLGFFDLWIDFRKIDKKEKLNNES